MNKLAIAIVLSAILIATALFLGSNRYYRMTYDPPERSFPTPPELELPPDPVAPNNYDYECETLKALVEDDNGIECTD